MKKVRMITSAAMLALMAVGTVSMTSCTKDECAAGYEGKDCTTEIRAVMMGSYNATDVNDADATEVYSYVAVATPGATVTIANLSNFGDFFGTGEIVTSNVTKTGNDISFTIPAQKPDGVYTVSGQGTYNTSTKKATVKYALSNGVATTNYTGTWSKQ